MAEVAAVGEAVLKVQVGQRVVVPFQISCGTCDSCQRGFTGNCTTVEGLASYGLGKGGWGGALSDLVLVPFADAMLVPLPAGITPEAVASASDNMPDAWRTVGPYLLDHPGAPVLIVGGAGSGSIGLYAAAIARALGASQVDYADQDARHLEIAQALGVNAMAIGNSFVQQKCGIVNPDNPCRCAKQVGHEIQAGILKPEKLRYATAERVIPDAMEVRTGARELRELDRAAALFRTHSTYKAPDVFIDGIRQLLSSGRFAMFADFPCP